MPATKAILQFLTDLDQPVITAYQLAVFLYKAYVDKKYKDIAIKSSALTLSKNIYKTKIERLCTIGILTPHPNFSVNQVFSIVGKKGFDASDVACSIDPFAYMSYLSAMAYHGITDRIPSILYVSTPAPPVWKDFALLKMEKDLDGSMQDFLDAGLPSLKRIRMHKLGKMPIRVHTSLHSGAYKVVKGRSIRVSTIGRTFLDMVRKPDLCGGMHHCIEVFRLYGRQYGRLIIDEVHQHGNNIEKSRVGYLLEEVCSIKQDRIDEWAQHVQRGGSRKLDPSHEYESTFSERWNISLNVPTIGDTNADM